MLYGYGILTATHCVVEKRASYKRMLKRKNLEFYMKKKIITPVLLLLSLFALTACPNNERNNTPNVTPLQTIPPVGSGGAVTNPVPLDSNIKSFECEFEGQREKTHKYWNSNTYIPKTISIITVNSGQKVYLRSQFLGFDLGNFGNIYMQYVPGDRVKSGADTLNIVNQGLSKRMNMTQSGYAGDVVQLMVDDQNMFISISCKGTTAFKGAADSAGKIRLICKGKSSTAIDGEEQINLDKPLNSIIAGESFEISRAISGKLDSKAATITYETSLAPEAPRVTSVASLKSPSTLSLKDKAILGASVDVTCKLQ